MIPETIEVSDVAVSVDPAGSEEAIEMAEASEPAVNYSEKSLAELVALFEELSGSEERMKMSKDAEAIKSAFYKKLTKEKAEAGILSETTPEEGTEAEDTAEQVPETVSEDPFAELERGFKSLYNKYKAERAEYNRQQEKEGAEPCAEGGCNR